MPFPNLRVFEQKPVFLPEEGRTVIPPPGIGRGFWAGGCSALYDEIKGRFYLCYRVRTPDSRGGVCRIAESKDGVSFETIKEIRREELDSQSIEKSSIIIAENGDVRLYISYVENRTSRWRIDLIEASAWEALDPGKGVPVLTPEQCGNQGVKDPVILRCNGAYHLYANYAPNPVNETSDSLSRMHAEGNAFVSGVVDTGTGLATSPDGRTFNWHGSVMDPDEGWDGFMIRFVSVIHTPPVFTVFHDGRPDVTASYEDKCGIAVSLDLRHFTKVSQTAPVLSSSEGTGCLRYLSAVQTDSDTYYYYEYARGDGSHELRMNRVEKGAGYV